MALCPYCGDATQHCRCAPLRARGLGRRWRSELRTPASRVAQAARRARRRRIVQRGRLMQYASSAYPTSTLRNLPDSVVRRIADYIQPRLSARYNR